MQDNALRVMSFAYKGFDDKPDDITKSENELVLAGIVGIIDPPREDVKKAIEDCKNASIRPIMITGDSLNTASAIALNVGIINSKDIVSLEKGIVLDGVKTKKAKAKIKKIDKKAFFVVSSSYEVGGGK